MYVYEAPTIFGAWLRFIVKDVVGEMGVRCGKMKLC